MHKLIFAILFHFTILIAIADTQSLDDALKITLENLQEPDSFEGEGLYITKKQAISGEPSIAKVGLLTLALIGEAQSIELVWWQSRDPEVRKLCVILLFYKARDGVVQTSLNNNLKQHCKRFKEEEAQERLNELEDFVPNLDIHRQFFKRLRDSKNKLAELKE